MIISSLNMIRKLFEEFEGRKCKIYDILSSYIHFYEYEYNIIDDLLYNFDSLENFEK